jgi:hypothetical protein
MLIYECYERITAQGICENESDAAPVRGTLTRMPTAVAVAVGCRPANSSADRAGAGRHHVS